MVLKNSNTTRSYQARPRSRPRMHTILVRTVIRFPRLFPRHLEARYRYPEGRLCALDKFASMKASIPAISPKGKLAFPGDFSDTTYDASDPDSPKLAGLKPDMSTVPEPRTLGYGFDDGPNCSHNAFYDYLAKKEQKATIGSNVMDWPLQAQRAVTDGHEICVHTWSHNYMTAFTSEGAFSELYYTMQAIKPVTGFTPTCWRPPFGDVDDRIRYIAAQLGLETILWKYDSNDWRAGTAPNITAATVYANYDALIANVSAGAFDTVFILIPLKEGAIMLTHELNNFTMQAAMDYYDRLADAFDINVLQYMVPISVAQNKTQPYTESNYKMPSFAEYTTNKDSGSDSGSRSGSNSHSKSSRGGTANVDQKGAAGVRPSGGTCGTRVSFYGGLYNGDITTAKNLRPERGVGYPPYSANTGVATTIGISPDTRRKIGSPQEGSQAERGSSSSNDTLFGGSVLAPFQSQGLQVQKRWYIGLVAREQAVFVVTYGECTVHELRGATRHVHAFRNRKAISR
ncbi:hypothetical protein C8J57DRAFT_1681251 [Mycena rebaudengoi]|nr:hypothetical protein C8J57DRAFT_1681251 [Mycena rebaudengoi]